MSNIEYHSVAMAIITPRWRQPIHWPISECACHKAGTVPTHVQVAAGLAVGHHLLCHGAARARQLLAGAAACQPAACLVRLVLQPLCAARQHGTRWGCGGLCLLGLCRAGANNPTQLNKPIRADSSDQATRSKKTLNMRARNIALGYRSYNSRKRTRGWSRVSPCNVLTSAGSKLHLRPRGSKLLGTSHTPASEKEQADPNGCR